MKKEEVIEFKIKSLDYVQHLQKLIVDNGTELNVGEIMNILTISRNITELVIKL